MVVCILHRQVSVGNSMRLPRSSTFHHQVSQCLQNKIVRPFTVSLIGMSISNFSSHLTQIAKLQQCGWRWGRQVWDPSSNGTNRLLLKIQPKKPKIVNGSPMPIRSCLKISRSQTTFKQLSRISKWTKTSGVITTTELIIKNVLTFAGAKGAQSGHRWRRGIDSEFLCARVHRQQLLSFQFKL